MKYLNLDAEGRLLSVSDIPFKGGVACDVDGLDFSGHRVLAYRYDGEKLIFDDNKYAELDAEAMKAETSEKISNLRQELSSTNETVLEALEGIFSATTFDGILTAIRKSRESLNDVLTRRASIREEIKKMNEGD